MSVVMLNSRDGDSQPLCQQLSSQSRLHVGMHINGDDFRSNTQKARENVSGLLERLKRLRSFKVANVWRHVDAIVSSNGNGVFEVSSHGGDFAL